MQIKSIAKMVIAGCAIGMLTGCGVPQEEHDAIVAKLTADNEQVVGDLNTKLADAQSLYDAEKERNRALNADLGDSSALNAELKESGRELKTSLATANTKISALESQLSTAQSQIKSAQSMAAEAENERAAAEMEAEEKERRFMALIENLIRLNKVKPSDLAWPELEGAIASSADSDSGSIDMGSDPVVEASGSPSSAADLLDEMGNL